MIDTDSRTNFVAFTFLLTMSTAACLSSSGANKCSRAKTAVQETVHMNAALVLVSKEAIAWEKTVK